MGISVSWMTIRKRRGHFLRKISLTFVRDKKGNELECMMWSEIQHWKFSKRASTLSRDSN